MWSRAMRQNVQVIRDLAARVDGPGSVCDIGCSDGAKYVTYAPSARHLMGLEFGGTACVAAKERGIDAISCDLREPWPLEDRSLAVVTSNQVIEHLLDVDHFVSETFRALRPGGRAVISTENLSSWHNLAAAALGWQPFSLTNISSAASGLGNPYANLRDDEPVAEGWHHVHVMAPRALKELFIAHGFTDVSVHGAGYFPFPARFAALDPRHAAFITVTGVRL
jgi:SAM-dependent methyltransferase